MFPPTVGHVSGPVYLLNPRTAFLVVSLLRRLLSVARYTSSNTPIVPDVVLARCWARSHSTPLCKPSVVFFTTMLTIVLSQDLVTSTPLTPNAINAVPVHLKRSPATISLFTACSVFVDSNNVCIVPLD